MRRGEIPFCECSIFHLEHKGTTAYRRGWLEAVCKIKLAAVFTAPFSSHMYLLLLLILETYLDLFFVFKGVEEDSRICYSSSVSPPSLE